jgi:hypothetical protein
MTESSARAVPAGPAFGPREPTRGPETRTNPPFLPSGLVATKPELRECKAVYILKDSEIGLFSDEVVVNCAP